jgi:hypothetical protein
MKRKVLRRWMVAVNSFVILLLALGAYHRYSQERQIHALLGAGPVPAHQLIREEIPALCIVACWWRGS